MALRLERDIVEELSLLGVEVVFSPVAAEHESLRLVDVVAALVIIDNVELPIKHEVVGMQFGGLLVDDDDMALCMHHIGIGTPVVESSVASDFERVALQHPDMSKSVERVFLLFEISAVAIEDSPLVTELHMSSHDLGVVLFIFVEIERVGMVEVDALVGSTCISALLRMGILRLTKSKQA